MGQKNTASRKTSLKRNDPLVLTGKQISMLTTATGMSEREIRQWHSDFIKDCPSGNLTKPQFIKCYQVINPKAKRSSFFKLAFNVFDKNKDGTIDFNEFMVAIAVTLYGDIREKLSMAFDMYDTDNNRFIDRDEIRYMLTAIDELNGGKRCASSRRFIELRVNDIMDQMDVDGDEKITKDEFIAACMQDEGLQRLFTGEQTDRYKSSQNIICRNTGDGVKSIKGHSTQEFSSADKVIWRTSVQYNPHDHSPSAQNMPAPPYAARRMMPTSPNRPSFQFLDRNSSLRREQALGFDNIYKEITQNKNQDDSETHTF
ncbi:hypothetical protein ACOME3_005084 [Neoechinorhynchus agilis]